MLVDNQLLFVAAPSYGKRETQAVVGLCAVYTPSPLGGWGGGGGGPEGKTKFVYLWAPNFWQLSKVSFFPRRIITLREIVRSSAAANAV